MISIKVFVKDNKIEIINSKYLNGVMCDISNDLSLLPDIGTAYEYLQFDDLKWSEKFYISPDNKVYEFTETQIVYLSSLVNAWVQPLGQDGNPTLEQAKEKQKDYLKGNLDAAAKQAVDALPSEMATWKDQEYEARAYIKDNTSPTPVLSILVESRGLGETVLDLANKVVANADAYKQYYMPLLGKFQALTKQVDAATTVEEVGVIVW